MYTQYRRWMIWLIGVGSLVLLAPMAVARESPFRGIHLLAGGLRMQPSPKGSESTFGGQAGVLIAVTDRIGLMAIGEIASFQTHLENPFGEGTYRFRAVSMGIVLRVLRHHWSPILLGGGVVHFSDFTFAGMEQFARAGLEVTMTSQNQSGGFVGAGLDLRLHPHFGVWFWVQKAFFKTRLNVEIREVLTNTSFRYSTKDVGIDPLSLHFGLLYRF